MPVPTQATDDEQLRGQVHCFSDQDHKSAVLPLESSTFGFHRKLFPLPVLTAVLIVATTVIVGDCSMSWQQSQQLRAMTYDCFH